MLQHTHIKGLAAKLAGFESIVEDIRHRPYALLDFEATQFDRDFLEFNVHIHDLELTLQARRSRKLQVACSSRRLHTMSGDRQGGCTCHVHAWVHASHSLEVTLQVRQSCS